MMRLDPRPLAAAQDDAADAMAALTRRLTAPERYDCEDCGEPRCERVEQLLCPRCDPASDDYDPIAACPRCGGPAPYRESEMDEYAKLDRRTPVNEVQPSWCEDCQRAARVAAWGAGR